MIQRINTRSLIKGNLPNKKEYEKRKERESERNINIFKKEEEKKYFNFMIFFQGKSKCVLSLTISLMPSRSAYATIETMTSIVGIFWTKHAITIAAMATTTTTREHSNKLQN